MLSELEIKDFQNFKAPEDEFHYHWIARRNFPKNGWEALRTIGDLTLCRIPKSEYCKIRVIEEINKIENTLRQVARSTIPMGGSDCDKFDIFIEDDIFDEVFKQVEHPNYIIFKRVMK